MRDNRPITSGDCGGTPQQIALALGGPPRPEVAPMSVPVAPKAQAPSPGLQRIAAAHAHLKKVHESKIALLAPKLADLAFRRGDYGVSAIDTRALGVKAGIITGGESGRQLSWIAIVPKRAGLIPDGEAESWTSTGNKNRRYLHPTFATEEVKQRAAKKRRRVA